MQAWSGVLALVNIFNREYPCPFGGVGLSVVSLSGYTMFPTTVSFCTNANQFSITCDPDRFMKVDYRLQELCPDARRWQWTEGFTRNPEVNDQFTKTMRVTVNGDYAALRRHLATKLRVTEYALSEELLAEVA